MYDLKKIDHISDEFLEKLECLTVDNIYKYHVSEFIIKYWQAPCYLIYVIFFVEEEVVSWVKSAFKLFIPQHDTALFTRSLLYNFVFGYI